MVSQNTYKYYIMRCPFQQLIKLFIYLSVLLIISCSSNKSETIIFNNSVFYLKHISIDKGKFQESYYLIGNKKIGSEKVLNPQGHQIFIDSNFVYYYDVGLPRGGYFFNILNNNVEFKFDIDSITNKKAIVMSNKIDSEYIYIFKNNSLNKYSKILDNTNFYNLKTGKYFIPYPGLLYITKIKLEDLFKE